MSQVITYFPKSLLQPKKLNCTMNNENETLFVDLEAHHNNVNLSAKILIIMVIYHHHNNHYYYFRYIMLN